MSDVQKLARRVRALRAHLEDQPMTHADDVDLATLDEVAAALSAQAEKAGWQLVPTRATPAMLDAGQSMAYNPNGSVCVVGVWTAMLAAAPRVEEKP